MKLDPQNTVPLAFAFFAGLLIPLTIALITGMGEPWDSEYYFTVGIPLMCIAIGVISYLHPARFWRWLLIMVLGQTLAMLSGGGSLSLWPFTLVAMIVVSLPQFLVALIVGLLTRRFKKGPDTEGAAA